MTYTAKLTESDGTGSLLCNEIDKTVVFFKNRIRGLEQLVDFNYEDPFSEIDRVVMGVFGDYSGTPGDLFERLGAIRALSFRVSNENKDIWDLRSESLRNFQHRSERVRYYRPNDSVQKPSPVEIKDFLLKEYQAISNKIGGVDVE